ncbi:MAG: M20/M25/M40 family metallo-hydrolase [Planctomycetaceae bacterium]|nr:M20/M25/M40 family metallo-hydrolase [Planctomycetaceae bacterium]
MHNGPMALRATALALLLAGGWASDPAPQKGDDKGEHGKGLGSIETKDAKDYVGQLASPWFEGRDSPSLGQDRAAAWIAAKLEAMGVQTVPGGEGYLHSFQRTVRAPDADACRLEPAVGATTGADADSDEAGFQMGRDFVPLLDAEGEAKGPLVFAGFGISVPEYDDLKGLDLKDAIAIFFEGEPRHNKTLEGPEVSPAANIYRKLTALKAKGAVGALVVRRPVPGDPDRPDGFPEDAGLAFRHTWATWQGERPDPLGPGDLPALELSLAAAERLTGAPLGEWAAELDKRGRPKEQELPAGEDGEPRTVRIVARLTSRSMPHPNVVGLVPGRDPALAGEYLVLGAHLDHVGVDPRGRIGLGADDNASGTTAALLVARALATARPKRPVLVCFFSAEEDGLLGAAALLDSPPIPIADMGFMLNLDMVGRGPKDSLVAIGARNDTSIEKTLERARKLGNTGIKDINTRGGQELWERSDHFEFAKKGLPVLFLFEDVPIEKNRDYHTWRDTPDLVEPDKIARAARLAFNFLWLLAEADSLPERPKR